MGSTGKALAWQPFERRPRPAAERPHEAGGGGAEEEELTEGVGVFLAEGQPVCEAGTGTPSAASPCECSAMEVFGWSPGRFL